jgi:mono/diheme cytochrome c family protein
MVIAVGAAAFFGGAGRAKPQATAERPVSFAREVKPLLARRCFACHGPQTSEGGLRLDDPSWAVAELDSGQHAIVPGDIEQSELLRRVSATDEAERMPPEGKPLTAEEVAALRGWIAQGAKWEKHWAFVPPVRHEPPTVKHQDWIRNELDAFILSGLEDADLLPATPADKRTLVRRAYFDVTGLPPTEEQLKTFLVDDVPDAWQRLVDELLASPHYGERWARHWLDVGRFAETNALARRQNRSPGSIATM